MRRRFRLDTTMRFLSSTRIVRVALALAVAFWMAGGGCLLGCENMATAAAATEITAPVGSPKIIATGEACASMQSHDCCARRGASRTSAKSKTPETPSSTAVMIARGATSSSMMDCPLALNAPAALAKAKQDQANSALLLTRANGALPHLQEQATALSPPPRLPNRGHTYLHCCVFLI
jgi:hypothetical protein